MGLIVLTGASGSGKTAIADAIAERYPDDFAVYRFDSIAVPPVDAMIRDHGSPEAWQRDKTIEWMARLAKVAGSGKPVLFEGQMRISFITEAATAADIDGYRLLLVDCDDTTRAQRLAVGRRQPELADQNMMNWAAYLRREAVLNGCEIFDTSQLSLDQCAAHVRKHLRGQAL
ncbi:RNase adaptor protein for sRNA GlmZ degradation [Rhizobium sp. BK313]|uniref:AAA family ATPase n=1 Tax=Rhizobium sp. BK313 TaxID=2587081 RepID=UPI00105FC39E|nr:AAA family ATPase [Rhizobium sp. BK313]MBB3453558.1 RNase adaptor protein for sRNA GlmZ degradation [Rhizobium sp. BK313]